MFVDEIENENDSFKDKIKELESALMPPPIFSIPIAIIQPWKRFRRRPILLVSAEKCSHKHRTKGGVPLPVVDARDVPLITNPNVIDIGSFIKKITVWINHLNSSRSPIFMKVRHDVTFNPPVVTSTLHSNL